jgi:hypothetical protein
MPTPPGGSTTSGSSSEEEAEINGPTTKSLLGRRTLAGMLSEALCSRARTVSERRPRTTTPALTPKSTPDTDVRTAEAGNEVRTDGNDDDEVPFARRAREQGKTFRGGKIDG